MDSDQDYIYESDSGNESSENDEIALECDSDEGIGEVGAVGGKNNDFEEYPFEVLTTEDITKHMIECIKEVNSIVNIPVTTIRILLNHFRWDKEKLMERFYDGDQESLFLEAHVVSPYKTTKLLSKEVNVPTEMEECNICFLKVPSSMMSGIECGHQFCTSCWTEYLTMKIMDEGMGQTISCAAHGCCILVDDQTVMNLLKDSKVKLKYQQLITKSFIECNRLLRWCPYPGCIYIIKVQYPDSRPVICKCENIFCFYCGENWHEPVKCNLLKKWIKKCKDDSETLNWIAANTKACPKCKVSIEKNEGCNHMSCTNLSCKANFCWVCLGPWGSHGSSWYSCNTYAESETKEARDSHEKSRSSLQRYLFYCNRYMNHMKSLAFEHKLYTAIKDKMEEMQQHNMSWIEVQFLKKAVDILCECRQTLMYTYVFAFYLQRNNQSVIFEDNQRDLETATETLSEYLERDITLENVVDIKQKVQDKYRYCDQRRRKLREHVQEGYDNDWWDYMES